MICNLVKPNSNSFRQVHKIHACRTPQCINLSYNTCITFHNAKWKKSVAKDHILYDSTDIKYKRQMSRRMQKSGCHRIWERGVGEWLLTENGVSFRGENILELDSGSCYTTLWIYWKHWIVHFKMTNFGLCINETVTMKRNRYYEDEGSLTTHR